MPDDDTTEKRPDGVDLGRRRFFRAFGREAIQSAATVAGTVDAIRRGAAAAAGELAGIGLDDPASSAARLGEARLAGVGLLGAAPGESSAGFRSPYRLTDDALVVLDQRRLPRIVETRAINAPEVAHLLRERVANGGLLLAQLAAYGLALSADRQRRAKPYARNALLRGAANALRSGRPSSRGVGWALDRLTVRWESVGQLVEGEVLSDALRSEADSIATELTADLARLGRLGAERLGKPDVELRLLVHGPVGALGSGLVGTGLSVVQALLADGQQLRVFVPVGGIARSGERVTAWELERAGVPFTVLPDTTVAPLVAEGGVDAILVAPERVGADGSLSAAAGTYPLALVAARGKVPFFACIHTGLVDLAVESAGRAPADAHTGDELRAIGIEPPRAAEAVVLRATDVTPPDLVTGFLTEEGPLEAPFTTSLPKAVEASASRREPLAEQRPDPARRAGPAAVEV